MNTLKRTGKRLLAFILCLTLTLSIPVTLAPSAQAAEPAWLMPYLDKMTSWGVVKGDGHGNYNSNRTVTRAEFVAMLNRAYGYTDTGPIPFTDVSTRDWFYDDIRIAYTAGIFHGTSATKASPNAPITREQAITLIARNMRMEESPGEVIDFTDGRDFSSYSRGYVKSAIAAGIIDGYSDGTVHPQKNVTRGEAMKMMCVGIGSLINTPGEHSPGGVFGNLTINCTNVTLKDTIITGDLYISGGISLGDVVLENVQVRGRIVVAGGGSSELGQNSVLLRGVDTNKLIVDAPTGQYISVRTEGRTHIQDGAFRSNAFFEDGCRDGYGILNVSLEGAAGDSFTLAGNLEKVVNRTPDSTLILGDAQVASVTVDERATGSKLLMEVNASADEVNLDVQGTAVEGTGDIGHLTINASGCSTTMLPDTISIRPGVNAEISGDPMDASGAQKYSEEPRILNGYPKVANVAPTTADGINSTNKPGTIYWGLTTAAVGAIPDTEEGRQSLISPSYSSGFVLSGSYPAETWEIDLSIPERLTGLTSSGTYFISAVLKDARGHVSPVYSERFETPDNITPAFSSRDYPYMSSIECEKSEVTVMANKNCDLYFALLPKGSTQPSTMDFLSFAGFDSAFGYGRIQLKKNKTDTIQVNEMNYPESLNKNPEVKFLQEQGTYDLYLWLTDAGGGLKSSAITKLTFTTRDKTSPVFTTEMQQQTMGVTNIVANCVLNEAGTIHWALVETGASYPVLPKNWAAENPNKNFLESDEAKFQVANHQNASKTGSVNTNGNVNATVNITGLEKEKAYDLYYIGVDRAGNYSDIVKKITVYTDDSTPPTAELSFSRIAPNTGTSTVPPQPYADADVRIEFSENILDHNTSDEPLELYNNSKDSRYSASEQASFKKRLTDILKANIKLQQMVGRNPTDVSNLLNFNNIELALERSGKLVLTFKGSDPKGITLGSGSTYRFEFQNFTDASPRKNVMRQTHSAEFTTVSALAKLARDVVATQIGNNSHTPDETGSGVTTIDMAFSMTPDSTESSEEGLRWDVKMWFDAAVSFDLYARKRAGEKASADNTGWTYLGTSEIKAVGEGNEAMRGVTLSSILRSNNLFTDQTFEVHGSNDNLSYQRYLAEKETWEYAIHVTAINSNTDRKDFTNYLTCELQVLVGPQQNLVNVLNQTTQPETTNMLKTEENVTDITSPAGFVVNRQFVDGNPPSFAGGAPIFEIGDSGVNMKIALNRTGRVYYLIVPQADLKPQNEDGTVVALEKIPEDGSGSPALCAVASPTSAAVMNPGKNLQIANNARAKYGSRSGVSTLAQDIPVSGLSAETSYYAYIVMEGSANTISPVYVFKFKTLKVSRPVLTLTTDGGTTVTAKSTQTGTLSYIIIPNTVVNRNNLKINDALSTIAEADEDGTNYTEKETIYRALTLDGSPESKGSLYDQFAKTTHKNALAQRINNTSESDTNIAGVKKDIPITQNQPLVLDCSEHKLSKNVEYLFLAVTKSNTGSAYAFRGYIPLQVSDGEPPKFDHVDSTLYVADGSASGEVKGRIYGQLVVYFDETLYQASGTALRPIHNAKKNTDTFQSVTYIVTSIFSGVTVDTKGASEQKTNYVSFTLSGAQDGAGMSFGNGLSDQYNNALAKDLSLSISIDKNNKVIIRDGNNKQLFPR